MFDQERKSTKAGDVELLKRVIRAKEGTFTGYIRELEGIEAPEAVAVEESAPETFKPFTAPTTSNDLSTPSTFENTTLN